MRITPMIPLMLLAFACNGDDKDSDTSSVTNTITNTVTETNTVTVEVEVEVPGPTVEVEVEVEVPDDDLDPGHFVPVIEYLQTLQDNGSGAAGTIGTGGAGENHMHLSEMVYIESRPDTDPNPLVANGTPALVFQCSYYFGFYDATVPSNMPVLAQGWRHAKTNGTKEPGCIHLALDDDDRNIVFTTHHGGITDGNGFLSGWDLNITNNQSDLLPVDGIVDSPTKISTITVAEIPKYCGDQLDSDGDALTDLDLDGDVDQADIAKAECTDDTGETVVAFEGLDVENDLIYVTEHQRGLEIFSFNYATNAFTQVALYDGGLENSWDVLVQGDLAYVADGIGGLVTLDVSDPLNVTELDRVVFDGQARDIMVNGTTVYVAAESGGIAIVDAADPANLQLVKMLDTGGSAIAIDYDNGKLYVAAWDDARVYDTSNPADPQLIGAVRNSVQKDYDDLGGQVDPAMRPDMTDRVLAIAGKDDYLFNGTWWVPTTWKIHPELDAPYIELAEDSAQLTIPGDVVLGASASIDVVVGNDGTADLTVYDVWSLEATYTVSPVGAVIPPGGEAVFTVTFTPAIGSDAVSADPEFSRLEDTIISFVSDDPNQPIREAYVMGNLEGLGIGDPFPETLVTLTDGGEWSYMADAFGSVTLVAYFATF